MLLKFKFKSEKHRQDFADVAYYNRCFAKYMPEVFHVEYDAEKLIGYMLVDENGVKIELPESEGGGGIVFDDEEAHLFMERIA